MPFAGFADISAEERAFSRSLKIRMGVADCLGNLAENSLKGDSLTFASLEELGGYCGNFIFEAGWDFRPGSSTTCLRWVKQYILPNGSFQLDGRDAGAFAVIYRDDTARKALKRMLRAHKLRRQRGK